MTEDFSDEARLIRFVVENPDDTLARKVVADYYRENGLEDRADLIEVQLRLSEISESQTARNNLMDTKADAERKSLMEREAELLRMARRDNWWRLPSTVFSYAVKNGFVENVTFHEESQLVSLVSMGDYPIRRVSFSTNSLQVWILRSGEGWCCACRTFDKKPFRQSKWELIEDIAEFNSQYGSVLARTNASPRDWSMMVGSGIGSIFASGVHFGPTPIAPEGTINPRPSGENTEIQLPFAGTGNGEGRAVRRLIVEDQTSRGPNVNNQTNPTNDDDEPAAQ